LKVQPEAFRGGLELAVGGRGAGGRMEHATHPIDRDQGDRPNQLRPVMEVVSLCAVGFQQRDGRLGRAADQRVIVIERKQRDSVPSE
jgi:hypothetical protein